jgi:single-strand DNA-binding protein
MAGYQYTIIVGNVGRDPELRYTQSGVAVCDFSVAVSRRWNDKASGQAREETTWFKVSAWRALAETCAQYLAKGRQVMVTGRVSADAYMGQDGQPRASLELTALDVQFLGSRGDAQPAAAEGAHPTEPENLPF